MIVQAAFGPGRPGFGVYVHWPFCAAKCPYCDFNSHVRRDAPDQQRFGPDAVTEVWSNGQLVTILNGSDGIPDDTDTRFADNLGRAEISSDDELVQVWGRPNREAVAFVVNAGLDLENEVAAQDVYDVAVDVDFEQVAGAADVAFKGGVERALVEGSNRRGSSSGVRASRRLRCLGHQLATCPPRDGLGCSSARP